MIVPCSSCGQKNRVPAERLAQTAKCGKCGNEVHATGRPLPISGTDFQDLIENSPIPVLVDFWAPWCGPCKMVAPELEKLATRKQGEVVVVKLNTDEHPAIAQREGVRGIPMFGLYKDGERVKTGTGYMSAEQLAQNFGL